MTWRLKKAIKKIMVGFDAPKFNPNELVLGKNVKFNLFDPETAYYWGWESAMLECGEILAKALEKEMTWRLWLKWKFRNNKLTCNERGIVARWITRNVKTSIRETLDEMER